MGLVLNLKKKLEKLGEKILVELSYLYIIQKAKQTSKKPDNSLLREYSPSHLTTEHRSTTIVTSSPATSEKTIMKLDKIDEIVDYVRDWSVDKIAEAELVGDKMALYAEFEEWIELDDEDSIDIMSSGSKIVDKPSEE
mgnify:FL=1